VAEAVGVTLPVEDGLTTAEYVGLAQLAERSGYDAVLAGEVAGPPRGQRSDYQTDGRKSRLGTIIEGHGEEDKGGRDG
jgi:alkanesulfonate monooxygenase SsuD/methylene tetrahydromethanopterin reductase-like flavin-dependent oxidoreductase (luciferase family)